MEQFQAFQVYINLKNQFQIFILKKVIYIEVYWAAQAAC